MARRPAARQGMMSTATTPFQAPTQESPVLPEAPVAAPGPAAGVLFTCNYVPALWVGMGTEGSFQYGRLVLTNPDEIGKLRQHPWFGIHIFEQPPDIHPSGESVEDGDADLPPSPAESLYRSLVRQDAKMGGWRCRKCGPLSPQFPSEDATIAHVRNRHRKEVDSV